MCSSQLQSWAKDEEVQRRCTEDAKGEVVLGTSTMCPVLRLSCVGSQDGYVLKEG